MFTTDLPDTPSKKDRRMVLDGDRLTMQKTNTVTVYRVERVPAAAGFERFRLTKLTTGEVYYAMVRPENPRQWGCSCPTRSGVRCDHVDAAYEIALRAGDELPDDRETVRDLDAETEAKDAYYQARPLMRCEAEI